MKKSEKIYELMKQIPVNISVDFTTGFKEGICITLDNKNIKLMRPPYKKQDKLCKHCGITYQGCGNSKWCSESCKQKNKRLNRHTH